MPPSKDEYRTETIIRDLLKQPQNKRCINCNSLRPQYVCTTFWTFVCTTCSGVHREFSHRVKSVSMAKFNEEELTALQAGGNERATEIYFKTWDPQRNTLPESCNLNRLREFIKHVYIDRMYTGQNNSNRIPWHNPDSRNDYNEASDRGGRNDFLRRLSFDRTSTGSREGEPNPMVRDNEWDFRNIFEGRSQGRTPRSSYEYSRSSSNIELRSQGRSPRNTLEYSRSGNNSSRSTVHFEIVDDRYRDDGSVKRYERQPSRELRSGSNSPVSSHRGSTEANLLAICPVKDTFGEKPPEPKVGEHPKANKSRDAETSARGQEPADGASPGRSAMKQERDKTVTSSSLIDCDAPSEHTRDIIEAKAGVTASKDDCESSSGAPSTTHTAANVSNMNLLESLFLDWSNNPAQPSGGTSQVPAGAVAAQPHSSDAINVGTTEALEVSGSPSAQADQQLLHTDRKDPTVDMTQVYQHPPEQQHHAFESPSDDVAFVSPVNNQFNPPPSAASVEASNNLHWNSLSASNDQGPVGSVQPEEPSQVVSSNDGSTKDGSKPNIRKELPQDLFALNFNALAVVGGWQMHPPQGTGYGMQFQPPAMPVAAAYASPSKPRNPFDITDDDPQVPSATFPSMSPLRGPLPNMPASAVPFGSQQSPYGMAFNYHIPQYGMHMPQGPGAYMGQPPNDMPHSRPQGNPNFGRAGDAFASLNPMQARGTDTFPAAPNPSVSRGNPFG